MTPTPTPTPIPTPAAARTADPASAAATYAWLRETMIETLRLPAEDIHPGATGDEAGLDSLAVTELVLIVHERWGIALDEDELYALGTVGEIAAYVAERVGADARSASADARLAPAAGR
ncbi:acyl carrier protein [Streptomyces sp. NPDC048337]|uniref:acyl carrier protein n=1 Tax=Streptomyces sp. NPDC048337 TaxID=3365535 RepID=UPI00371C9025